MTIRNIHYTAIIRRTFLGLVTGTMMLVSSGAANADQFDDQINALKAQQAQQQAQAATLHAQASNYQQQAAQYQAQINVLNTQIALGQAESNKLSVQIQDAQTKMAQQKTILAANIKAMYLNSDVTPLEMLASSSDISDFFNQQQYQDKVKTKIQDAMKAILALKDQLEKQQSDLTALLASQRGQQQQLSATQANLTQLMNLAASNAAAADQQVAQQNSQIASLRAQQAAANRAALGGGKVSASTTCGGGYPWCHYAQDTVVDSWGMYNRECVSYTAFRVSESHSMPYWGGDDGNGHGGNAKQWVADARDGWRGASVTVSSTPHVGDVAISTAGTYGHAMYVEGVSGNNIYVSQYNYNLDGNYSTMTTSASGLYFLTFH